MTFDTIDYTHWIEKVKKELKLEALDEKYLTLLDGQTFNPFFEREKHQNFHFDRKEFTWQIGELVDLSNTTNAKLLQMLEGGAQKLHLSNASINTDFEQLFEGVFLSMIEIHLETDNEDIAGKFWKFVTTNDQKSSKNHSCSIGLSNHVAKKTITIGSDEHALVKFCETCISHIEKQGNQSWESIVDNLNILITVRPKGIEHIAFVDATRKLWNHICRSFGEEIRTPRISQVVAYDTSLSVDENFISASVQAVNAVIATGVVLFIENAPDNNDFSRTINRNMQHLLQLESFMNQSAYAYKGSYVIEKMSEMFVENTWNQISVKTT